MKIKKKKTNLYYGTPTPSLGDKLSKYINKKTNEIRKKGHEKMTFMIIPHTQKNMFSIQVTKFGVFFSIATFCILILNAIISGYTDTHISKEINTLYNTDKSFDSERSMYITKLKAIDVLSTNIKEDITTALKPINKEKYESSFIIDTDELNLLAQEQMQAESYAFYLKMNELLKKKNELGFNLGELQNSFLKEFEENKIDSSFQYDSEVVLYRELYLNIKQMISEISNTYTFLNECEEVRRNLPYAWPLDGGHITSKYGIRYSPFGIVTEFHMGVDIAQAEGTPVYAAGDGYIVTAQYGNSGYGRSIRIAHRFGYASLYGHLSAIIINQGQLVKKGQRIGYVGTTGRSTGPHLHFEVKLNEQHIDPLPFLKNI